MRLVRYRHDGAEHTGALDGEEVIGLGDVPVVELLDPARRPSEAAVAAAPRLPRERVALVNPLPRPRLLLAIGLNYADHAAESGQPVPEFPIVFNKQVSCVTGPYDPIHFPRAGTMLDYEGELAFVVGRRCRHVPEGRGLACIGGYTVINDVSVRDWQFRSPTWTLGKSFDTHGPLGPAVVTADELGDPHGLRLRTWVNGELRQDSSTDQLIFDCGRLVELLSTVCTLEPGDVVATGTPAGIGMTMDPSGLLRVGDVVRVEIEGIGAIENPVVAEPDDTAIW
jgi:2-keto-4-pentenoate hydratase/2-oxohepta-3-ene-1,7-dioic acid hydratase in catechol pathway